MGMIDLVAVCVVCATVLAIYLLERKFLAALRDSAAEHAMSAEKWGNMAKSWADASATQTIRADQHAARAAASADRACDALDKDRVRLEGRLASLEARR